MDFRFYHLDSNPFATNFSDHLFWHVMHQSVWDGLLERIDARQGVIAVLGQAGLGKSTLLQAYRASVDPKYVHVIEGVDTTQSLDHLLASLAYACGLPRSDTDAEARFNAVYQHCHAAHACGRQLVLLIDDAHTLTTHALGNLYKLFEHLHREDEPLMQIVLCGRPTLPRRCQYPGLYLFEQAMSTALTLSPLAPEDRAAYIQHYLQAASAQASPIFTKDALKRIIDHTDGIPKMINITCSDVLVAGLLAGEKPISAETVSSVLGDDEVRTPAIVRWGLISAAALFLVVGFWATLPKTPRFLPHATSTATSQVTPQPPTPAIAEAQAPVPTPATSQVSPPSQRPSPNQASLPDRAPISAPAQVQAPALATVPVQTQPPPQTLAPTLWARAVATAAQLISALRPAQAAVSEPDTPRHASSAPALDTQHAPGPPTLTGQAETTAPVVPAAFTQTTSDSSLIQRSEQPQPLVRLHPSKPRHSTMEPQSRPRRTRAPLIASVKARLLCAMPRTDGPLGSDIVFLGHTRHSVHRLIDDGSQNMSPVLSPDGTHLAYTSYRGGTPNIYLRHLVSDQDIQITSGPRLALPGTWSPNGRYLSLSQSVHGNNDIYVYDMTQHRLRRLTQHKGIDVSPSFAPDSQRLVFSSDRTGSPQLYITDTAGSPPVRLTRNGPYNTSPAWSPRDDTIAFVGRSKNKALDLYTIQSDGSQRQRLTQGQRFHTPPAWLPDGHTVMGMSLRGSVWKRHLVQLNPNRTAPVLPKPESLCLAPQWVAYRAR